VIETITNAATNTIAPVITSDAGRVRAQPCGAPLTEQAPMTRQRS
jgi:hypothetical protein